jgi:hypothetical protein
VEPLLELIEDKQHLALRWQDTTLSQLRQRLDQTQFARQFRTNLTQALQEPSFGLLWRRLDVNQQYMLVEPGKKSGLHQR